MSDMQPDDDLTSTKVISLSAVRMRIGKCEHKHLIVDEQLSLVTCQACGEQINPIYVLSRMATEESLWMRRFHAMNEAREKLKLRQRCKCDHCGRMTQIHIR